MQHIDNITLNFILSTARTGGTLLSSMLNMHPNIISTSEEPFAINLYPRYSEIKDWDKNTIEQYCDDFILFSDGLLDLQFTSRQQLFELLLKHQTTLNFERVIRLTYLSFLPEKNKDVIHTIVDKYIKPDLFFEKILNYYPQSKIIILCRDPRDTALIRFKFNQRKEKKTDYFLFAFNWDRIYSALYQKYEKDRDSKFLIVRYEDLVSTPEAVLNNICAFLGIKYNPVMLETHIGVQKKIDEGNLRPEQLKEFETVHLSLTQKINTDKIDIWKKEMNLSDANIVWDICKDSATKIGYKKHADFVPIKKNSSYYFKKIKRFFLTTTYKFYYYFLPYRIKKIIKKNNRKSV